MYATSLGFLDFCVAQYSITDQRATSTEFFVLDSFGVYLIVRTDAEDSKTGWQSFLASIDVVFQPLTKETWFFITLFVIPVFGILMVYHEYGKSGSSFPSEEKVIAVNEDGTMDLRFRRVPISQTIVKSLYTVSLSVLQQAYEQPITTVGAKLNLLGVSVFILTVCAAYTANLAALLTQQAQKTGVGNLDDAIRAGYRFCAERKNMESIVAVNNKLQPSLFVVDPVDEGGDGQPGFNCPLCNGRVRVFDFMDPKKADAGDSRYCHAALAPLEDLEALHSLPNASHCNLTHISTPVHFSQTGFPVFEGIAPQIMSLFVRLKNEGVMDQVVINAPESGCPAQPTGEEIALNLSQLTGIWIVSFGFAAIGLIFTICQPFFVSVRDRNWIRVHKLDQIGAVVETIDTEDNVEVLRSSVREKVRNLRNRDEKGRSLPESIILSSTDLDDDEDDDWKTNHADLGLKASQSNEEPNVIH